MEPISVIEEARTGDVEELEERLRGSVDLNLQDDRYGQTAISWASENGHFDAVKLLLKRGAKTDIPDTNGHTPLYWACRNEHYEIAEFLLSRIRAVQEVLHRDPDGMCPLSFAAWCGAVDNMKRFLATPGIKKDSQDERKLSPLMYAAKHGHEEAARILLDDSVDATLKDDAGRTALYFAAGEGHLQVVQLLIQHLNRADVNGDVNGNEDARPLIAAADRGYISTVRALIQAKADFTLNDTEGKTPLLVAMENEHAGVVRELLQAAGSALPQALLPQANESEMKAKIGVLSAASIAVWDALAEDRKAEHLVATDSDGRTALHYAASFGFLEAAQRLLDAGSKVDALDTTNCSPLVVACSKGHLPIVEFLLEKGADQSIRDSVWGQTPLMFAAESGHDKVVEYLCDHGSDINAGATGFAHRTPLIFAAREGNPASVKALLQRNADLERVDSRWGQSALSWAIESDHIEAARFLIQAGADLYSTSHQGYSPLYFALQNSWEQLHMCITEPTEAGVANVEPVPRARAVEIALRVALELGSIAIFEAIFENEEYLNAEDQHHRNVISFAAENGTLSEIRKLCGKNLVFSLRDDEGRTPLSWAAAKGEVATVKLLLGKDEVALSFDEPDEQGRTPLSWAAAKGKKEAMGLLLDRGAIADSPDRERRTPLSWAAGEGRSSVVEQLLTLTTGTEKLPGGGGKNAQEVASGRDDQPAHGTSRSNAETDKGKPQNVEVDSRDITSWTPLCHAAWNGHQTVVEILLAHGADPTITVNRHTRRQTLRELLESKMKPSSPDSSSDIDSLDLATVDAIRKMLISRDSLLTMPLIEAEKVDKEFSATVAWIPIDEGSEISWKRCPLDDILRAGLPKELRDDDHLCRWLHIPANNVSFKALEHRRVFKSKSNSCYR